jgi:rhamnose transport system permease protein
VKRLALSILRSPILIPLALLVLACVIGTVRSPDSFELSYILGRSADLMPIALLALAMTFIIIAGQIDLSVGSGAVLVMVATALLYRDAGVPMGAMLILAPLMGALLGLFNGALVTCLRVPPLVVTLGTLALYRGLAMVLMGEQSIGKFPGWFSGVDMREVAGFPAIPVLIFLAFAVVAAIVLHFTTFGRRVYSIGTSESASRYAGIRTDRVKLILFTLAGVAMGFAALMQTSVIQSASYKHFTGAELTAITAVVLGGTSINGGRGNIAGTVIAVFLLAVVGTVMGVENVRAENQLAITGTMLVAAVVVNDLLARLTSRTGRRS